MFQRMTIWGFPSSATLFHSQSWWCASFCHSIKFIRVSSSIVSHVSKDDDMKVSFKYIFVSPLLTGFTRAWTIWNDIAPSMIWMCSFIDYLSLNIIVFSSLIHHLLIFHCLIADLNTACFSFSGSTVLLPAAQLFKKCRGLQCHFYQRFHRLNRCSSISDNLPCFGINSHISKIMYIRSLVCWNEIIDVPFLKRPFENQAFWSKTQHTLFEIYSPLIVMYFENRNWPVVRLKWLFSFLFFFMVLCIHFRLWFWVYLLMVCDWVTFFVNF